VFGNEIFWFEPTPTRDGWLTAAVFASRQGGIVNMFIAL
jgi:hypothetical protein